MKFSKMDKEHGAKYIISFRKAKKLYKNYIERDLSIYDLSENEIEIIMCLNRNPMKNTAKDLVEYLGLSKGMISRTIDQLVAKEILEFEKDKKDKRIYRLKISDKSNKLIKDLEVSSERFFSGLIKNVDDDRLETFTSVLEDMIINMKGFEK